MLLLFDMRLQSHRSAEKTDRNTILVSGFDKAERCVPSAAYVLYQGGVKISVTAVNSRHAADEWGIGRARRKSQEKWDKDHSHSISCGL